MNWVVKVIVFVSLLSSVFVITTESAPESALITKLPGFNRTFPLKHYSGYVEIDKEHGKNMWYYFVESEKNPSKDPVVLWFHGGPGCSSMDGFVYEPAKKTDTFPLLHLNPYSWSKVSNIIYLDSPVVVGFSYSKNKTDYETGDMKTAFDSHSFLLKWFQMYSEFESNPFYISGESYAEIYVPTLAIEVVQWNKDGLKPAINFKGYLVGNGVADSMYDGNALVPFAYGMGLIFDQLFEVCLCVRKRMFGRAWPVRAPVLPGVVPSWTQLLNDINVPCINDSVARSWLNDPTIRKAIHAKEKSEIGS